MKRSFQVGVIVSLFTLQHLNAQPAPPGGSPTLPPPSFQERVRRIQERGSETPELTHFNLDFPGGTAKQLADSIEKAMGKPLNVIVPPEFANAQLPPIRVNDVTVPQLFETLQQGSRRYVSGNLQSSYGFNSIDGPRSDNTIWTFSVYTNEAPNSLTKFNIDFPGGTPRELVAAIQRASGHPLNVIIPDEFADTKLPALKMNNVNVSDLFRALQDASVKTEPYVSSTSMGGYQSYSQKQTSYGFKFDGKLTDETIWYFYVDKLPRVFGNSPDKVCRFYALAPYLDRGLKVDDITTAIETGWKMAGETAPPAISFHKDTKLLIAVGDPNKLQTIDNVLQALKPETPKPPSPPPPPKKTSDNKTEE